MQKERLNEVLEEYLELELKNNDQNIIFILNNLPLFSKISFMVYDIFSNIEIKDPEINGFTKMSFFEKVKLVDEVINSSGLEVRVEDLLTSGVIETKYLDEDSISSILDYFFGCIKKENSHLKIEFPNSGYAIDAVVLSHELGHYLNNIVDTRIISALTETTSIYIEKNMLKKFKELGLFQEYEYFINVRNKDTLESARVCRSTTSLLLTYITFGKVTKENFNKLFKNANYEDIIKNFDERSTRKFIYKLPYLIGELLSSYFTIKVKNDPSFKFNIKMFSDNIYKKSPEYCLSLVGINELDERTLEILSASLIENKQNPIETKKSI